MHGKIRKIIRKQLLNSLSIWYNSLRKGAMTLTRISPDLDEAMIRLMNELKEGRSSGEEIGWVAESEARAYFQFKAKEASK